MKEKNQEKNLKIQQLREDGLTQEEIAVIFGITRQRIQQIEKSLGLTSRRTPGVYKTYSSLCKTCGKEFISRVSGRVFCSSPCFFESRKKQRTEEEKKEISEKKKERSRIRSRRYYYDVFKKRDDWQKITKERNDKYISKYKRK